MQRFVYKARTKTSRLKQGKIEARDATTAVGMLRERGLVVISMKLVSESRAFSSSLNFLSGVRLDDVVTFTRQLATMMSSGLPLTEALSVLELQARPAMAKVINEILRDVQGGGRVADAMERHPRVFSGVYVALVRAGEAAGSLDAVLERLADNLEKQKQFRAKTRGALIYPALVILGMLAVTIIMVVFVIPKLSQMYEDLDAQLPLPTLVLVGLSSLVANYWWLLAVMVVVGVILFRRWRQTARGKIVFDELLLEVPVMGRLRAQMILAEMTRTLSLLVGSGVALVESLGIVSGVVDNEVYKQALSESIKGVKRGVLLSATLARGGIFPPILPNMVAVGEETGKMDDMLLKVSAYFEEEAEQSIKNLTTLLEPLIMVVLGVGVGFLVISVILPIYNLTNQF